MNTNMHVTQGQAATMLNAVRFTLQGHYWDGEPDDSQERKDLEAVERMLLAALARISDATDKRNKTGIWA